MAKPSNKNNKERCKRYEAEGRRELNKKKKQEKNEKRMKRFADRREAGKTYQYDKKRTEQKIKDGVPIGTNLGDSRWTEVAEWDSISAELNNIYIKEKKRAAAAAEARSRKDGEE